MALQDPGLKMTNKFDIAGEMSGVPFGAIISGAFIATCDSQLQASMTTIAFVESVGFTGPGNDTEAGLGEPVMVDFVYDRPGGLMGLNTQQNKVTVPFLTMVPLPAVRIESLKIQFNVRITQTRAHELNYFGNSMSLNSDQTTQEGTNNFGSIENKYDKTTSFFTIVTDTAQNKQGNTVSREYSMKVTVQAVQDEIPAGTQRILDILASAIERKSGDVGLQEVMGAMESAGGMGGAE